LNKLRKQLEEANTANHSGDTYNYWNTSAAAMAPHTTRTEEEGNTDMARVTMKKVQFR